MDLILYVLIPAIIFKLFLQKYFIGNIFDKGVCIHIVTFIFLFIVTGILLLKDITFKCGSLGKKVFHFIILDIKTNKKPKLYILIKRNVYEYIFIKKPEKILFKTGTYISKLNK